MGEANQSPPKNMIDLFGDVDEVLRSSIRRFIRRTGDDDDADLVRARVVGFMGGSWAAFTPSHQIIIVSHLFDLSGGHQQEVAMTSVANISTGDVLLLRTGSDRDAVRELAELRISPSTIQLAELWKRALRDYLCSNPSLENLQTKLGREGCNKELSTIRRWITDDNVIGPQHVATDIAAIAKVTGDELLTNAESDCAAAIVTVRSAHVTAGMRLAEEVVRRVGEWAEAGATPDEMVELEDRLVMVTVEFVEHKEIDVPISVVNRLQSSSWHG